MISYTLNRKRNCKNVKIRVKQGEVIVSSPYSVSKSKIDQFVLQNEKWILSQLNKQDHSSYKDGDVISIYGREYTIHVGNQMLLKENEMYIRNQKDFDYLTTQFATKLIQPMVENVFNQLNMKNITVEYKTFQSKWGSFNKPKMTMKLNSYLIYTNYDFTISVILHECAHLYEMNHSQKFYKILLTWYPPYKEVQKSFKNFQFPRII